MHFNRCTLLATALLFTVCNISHAQWQHMEGPYVFSTQEVVSFHGKLYMAAATSSKKVLYVSTNLGDTWDPILIPGYDGYLQHLFVNEGTLIVATHSQYYVSSNEGATWTKRNFPGLAATSFFSYSNVLLSSDNNDTYVSVDQGESWHKSPGTKLPRVYTQCAIVGNTFYIPAGYKIITVSLYQGLTIGERNAEGYTINGVTADGTTLYCGTDKGIIASYNSGVSWEEYATVAGGIRCVYTDDMYMYGIHAQLNRIYRIEKATGVLDSLSIPFTVQPEDHRASNGIARLDRGTVIDGNLYVYVSARGLVMSTDHGETWTKRNGKVAATAISQFVSMGNHLFASAGYCGVIESSDGGRTWFQNTYDGRYYDCTNIAGNSTTLFTTNNACDILASTDHGRTWEVLATPQAPYNRVVSSGPFSLAATDQMLFQHIEGVRKSADLGATWTDVSASARHLQKHNDVVYARLENGVTWTTDHGATWNTSLVEACVNDQRLRVNDYAVTDHAIMVAVDTFLYANENFGQVWRPVPRPSNWTTSYAARLFSAADGFILTDTENEKVFFTRDFGAKWKDLTTGLPAVPYAYHEHNGYLYASMDGVWRRSIVDVLPVDNPTIPSSLTLAQNYPNPVSGNTTIGYTLPASDHVSLTVTNSLGQEVARLVDTRMEAGTHSVPFSTAGLVPGVYFYTLRTGSATLTKGMLAR